MSFVRLAACRPGDGGTARGVWSGGGGGDVWSHEHGRVDDWAAGGQRDAQNSGHLSHERWVICTVTLSIPPTLSLLLLFYVNRLCIIQVKLFELYTCVVEAPTGRLRHGVLNVAGSKGLDGGGFPAMAPSRYSTKTADRPGDSES